MPLPASPLQGRYTRQQIADAVGIASDLLGYWIKEGLLIAAEGEGLGKGKHRFFGFEAIHIAAVLKELGRYGVQTAGLRQVADLLWQVVAFCSEYPEITEEIRHEATMLHRAQARYPAHADISEGEEVSDADYACYEDWLEDRGPFSDKALEIAHWFDEGADLAFALYLDLFTQAIFESFDTRWLFTHAGGELAAMPENLGHEELNPEHMPSYIMVNLSRIIRPIWML